MKTFTELDVTIARCANTITSVSDASLAAPLRRKRIQNVLRVLADMQEQILIAQSVGPEMFSYINAQKPTGFDAEAELLTLQSTGVLLADWVNSNIPRAAGGVVFFDIDSEGKEIDLTFGVDALAQFRVHAATFLALVS